MSPLAATLLGLALLLASGCAPRNRFANRELGRSSLTDGRRPVTGPAQKTQTTR